MVSNHFALFIILRIGLLTLSLVGLSMALINPGFYIVSFVLAGIAAVLLFDLYRYVSRTNGELIRFIDALRYEDFSQRFHTSETGANFEKLSKLFSDTMDNIKQTRQEQEEKLRHLKSLTEHVPVPLISLLPDGRIHLHNNAARRLFSNVNINNVEDLDQFNQNFSAEVSNLKPGDRRLINFCHDGMERQLTVAVTQIVTGKISEKLISLQDIQNELDGMQLQTWQDLVRVLTHEIMNSITPVASLAKTATDLVDDVNQKLESLDESKLIREELEDVGRAVSTVARRSDGLMQFVQSYRSLTLLPPPNKKTLSLNDLFQSLAKLHASEWSAKGIALNINIEPESLQLNADPDLLEQLLINLLRNAEQALLAWDNPEGLDLAVTLKGRMNLRGYVLIEVIDNGPGIPPDILDKIFLPFFSTKQDGSGVGLALTRQIMIAHGGSVSVDTPDSGGTKFTLIF